MKLNQKKTSTQAPTFKKYETYIGAVVYRTGNGEVLMAIAPNRPTPEAVAKAQFVDKTYVWSGK